MTTFLVKRPVYSPRLRSPLLCQIQRGRVQPPSGPATQRVGRVGQEVVQLTRLQPAHDELWTRLGPAVLVGRGRGDVGGEEGPRLREGLQVEPLAVAAVETGTAADRDGLGNV